MAPERPREAPAPPPRPETRDVEREQPDTWGGEGGAGHYRGGPVTSEADEPE